MGTQGTAEAAEKGLLPWEAPALSPAEEPPVPGLLAELPHFRGHSGRGLGGGAARGVARASSRLQGALLGPAALSPASRVRSPAPSHVAGSLRAGGLKEILMHRVRQRPAEFGQRLASEREKKKHQEGSGRRELKTCVPAES